MDPFFKMTKCERFNLKIINYNDYDNNYSLIVIITCVD